MLILIVCLLAPVAVSPLIVLGTRSLFAIFVREGASLFVGLEMHHEWAMTLARPISIGNGVIFALAWWAAIGLSALGLSNFALASPFIVALVFSQLLTWLFVKERLHLQNGTACMVSLVTFAGGNLPMIVALPLLVMAVPQVSELNLTYTLE